MTFFIVFSFIIILLILNIVIAIRYESNDVINSDIISNNLYYSDCLNKIYNYELRNEITDLYSYAIRLLEREKKYNSNFQKEILRNIIYLKKYIDAFIETGQTDPEKCKEGLNIIYDAFKEINNNALEVRSNLFELNHKFINLKLKKES